MFCCVLFVLPEVFLHLKNRLQLNKILISEHEEPNGWVPEGYLISEKRGVATLKW